MKNYYIGGAIAALIVAGVAAVHYGFNAATGETEEAVVPDVDVVVPPVEPVVVATE